MNIVVPLIVFVVSGVALVAQGQAQGRDRTAAPAGTPATGKGSIAGIVTTEGDQPQPLRHTTVLLSAGTLSMPRMAVTDDEGRFFYDGLTAGTYLLVPQRAAWVPAAKGIRMANQTQGIPIAVRDGQSVTGVTLRMLKGAVVSGTIRMPGGRAAAGLSVQAMAASSAGGSRTGIMSAAPAQTDDQGRFRIFGLAPGQYVVQVRQGFAPNGSESRQVLPSEIRWAEALVAQGTSPALSSIPRPEAARLQAFSTTYFPGTAFLSDATPLTLRAGEERLNVDFEVLAVPTATVSGTVLGPDGAPYAGAAVSLHALGTGDMLDVMLQFAGGQSMTTRPDGTFAIAGISPGTFEVRVRATRRAPGRGSDRPLPSNPLFGMMGMSTGGADLLWAQDTVAVNGQPVGPLGLQLREGVKVSGTIAFEGDKPPGPSQVRVAIGSPMNMPGVPDAAMFRVNQQFGTVTDALTFEVPGLIPGAYRVAVNMPGMRLLPTERGAGWVVKSVRLGERELADAGLDLSEGRDVSGLVVTVTNRLTELTGRVLDGASQPVSAYPMVVFSADRAHWTAGSRRVHSVQPATDGSYFLSALPAGPYYLAVVHELDMSELTNASFLESLVSSALQVTLADGEKKTQDIRVQGGGLNPEP